MQDCFCTPFTHIPLTQYHCSINQFNTYSKMSSVTQLHNTTPEQLQEAILKGVKSQLEQLKREYQPKEPEEYLSRSEVAKMLKVDISTVHNWSKSGKLQRHGIGNRVYFKRSEVERAIIQL